MVENLEIVLKTVLDRRIRDVRSTYQTICCKVVSPKFHRSFVSRIGVSILRCPGRVDHAVRKGKTVNPDTPDTEILEIVQLHARQGDICRVVQVDTGPLCGKVSIDTRLVCD